MKGIYVDRWRTGLKNKEEVDALLKFCDDAKLTDLFVHVHEDIAVNNNWDYLDYILKNRGDKRIHAWVSLTVGRDNDFTREKLALDFNTGKIDGFINKRDIGEGIVITLNPDKLEARVFFLNKVKVLVEKYPDLYGFHVDKLPNYSELLVRYLRKALVGKYFSVPVIYSKSRYYARWEIDEAIPMFVNYSNKLFDNVDLKDFKHIALGCYSCALEITAKNILKCKELGVEPIFYSYGAYSFRPTETREQFAEVIRNGSR